MYIYIYIYIQKVEMQDVAIKILKIDIASGTKIFVKQ